MLWHSLTEAWRREHSSALPIPVSSPPPPLPNPRPLLPGCAAAFWAATGMQYHARPDDDSDLPRFVGGIGDMTTCRTRALLLLPLLHGFGCR